MLILCIFFVICESQPMWLWCLICDSNIMSNHLCIFIQGVRDGKKLSFRFSGAGLLERVVFKNAGQCILNSLTNYSVQFIQC